MAAQEITVRVVYQKELAVKDNWRLFLAEIEAENGSSSVEKCSGIFSPMYEGQPFSFVGHFEVYKGENIFRVTSYTTEMPANQTETLSFIRSIKGIGKKRGKVIAEYCEGDLQQLDPKKDIDALCALCPGLKRENVEKMLQRLTQIKTIAELQKRFGTVLTVEQLGRITTKYEDRTEHVLLYHPYWIASLVGFDTADAVGEIDGVAANNAERIEACVKVTLNALCRKKNSVMVPTETLIPATTERLKEAKLGGVQRDDIVRTLNLMRDKHLLVRVGRYTYSRKNYDNEVSFAQFVANQGNKQVPKERQDKYSRALNDWLCSHSDIQLSAMQTKAAVEAGRNCVSVITGGPGTGKTTCLDAIVESYKAAFPEEPVLLLAPTGLAAKRMAEKTGKAAATIHSAFRLIPIDDDEKDDFGSDYNDAVVQTVASGLVLIDEFSMVDLSLASFLIRHINFNSTVQVVFIGDPDQLPPVAAGNVLEALIRTNVVPVTRLDKNYRQDAASRIPALAAAINAGAREQIKMEGGCCFENAKNTDICAHIQQIYLQEVRKYGIKNVLLLTPMRKKSDVSGDICAERLNAILRDAVNPATRSKADIKVGDKKVFRVGDRVINTKNAEGVVNGDIGTVVGIEEGTLRVEMDFGAVIEYESKKANEMLDFAYAVTVHKAQGSEFKVVLMPFAEGQEFMLTRKLVYTAVTRAQNEFIAIGNWDLFVASSVRVPVSTVSRDLLGPRIIRLAGAKNPAA